MLFIFTLVWLMARKLISGRYYMAIITMAVIILLMYLFQLHGTYKLSWSNIWPCGSIELVAGIGLWWFLTLKHPVYFDEVNVYWGKPGSEHLAAIASIKSVTYNYEYVSRLVWIKYSDADNHIKTIRFYTTTSWSPPYMAYEGMKEFENYVKQKNTAVEFKRRWW